MATATGSAELERQLEEFVLRFDAAYARAAATVGLSGAQACALGWTEERMSMGALARVLVCDASNVSQIVARLEARGLVEREPDPADRRVKHVTMTPEGRATHERVRVAFSHLREGIGRLDPDERRELARLLEKIAG